MPTLLEHHLNWHIARRRIWNKTIKRPVYIGIRGRVLLIVLVEVVERYLWRLREFIRSDGQYKVYSWGFSCDLALQCGDWVVVDDVLALDCYLCLGVVSVLDLHLKVDGPEAFDLQLHILHFTHIRYELHHQQRSIPIILTFVLYLQILRVINQPIIRRYQILKLLQIMVFRKILPRGAHYVLLFKRQGFLC